MYKVDFKNVSSTTLLLKDTEKICKPCYTIIVLHPVHLHWVEKGITYKHVHAENEIRYPRVNPVLKCFKH